MIEQSISTKRYDDINTLGFMQGVCVMGMLVTIYLWYLKDKQVDVTLGLYSLLIIGLYIGIWILIRVYKEKRLKQDV